jgi:DNA processing protein
MDEEEKKYWIAWSTFPAVGPVRFKLLKEYFGSAKDAYTANAQTLQLVGLSEKLVSSFVLHRKSLDIDEYINRLSKQGVFTLTTDDSKYPQLLKEIVDAPFVLYGKGKRTNVPVNISRTIAVVGTRKISAYGTEMTEHIVSDLLLAGCTIVSGLAYGVDATAHKTAIESGGKTIAVLGSGIDIIAPSGNARIYEEIVSGSGVVLSEYPLGFAPTKWTFPLRNRIISGLSLGVVVIEGVEKSGALITARRAAEQGRDVFAVPGSVMSPLSRGPAQLLKNGAILIENGIDVLEALGITGNTQRTTEKVDGSKDECAILALLKTEGRMFIDDIVHGTNCQ